MSIPKFSIVLPTRDRIDTLEFALKTCLDSYSFKVEVVVFDNSKYEGVENLISNIGISHGNTVVRYKRSDRDLAMTHSWEQAVKSAVGEYVTVIGDDDGLLPNSLNFVASVLDRYPSNVVRFSQAAYGWPSHLDPRWRDHLIIPLAQQIRWIDAAWLRDQVATFNLHYRCLPMIYNSFIKRDFLNATRERFGSVFSAASPDIESGFLIASTVDRFLNCSVPVSIAGGSHRSNGSAHVSGEQRKEILRGKNPSNDFRELNEAQGIHWPEEIPYVAAIPVAVAEAVWRTTHRITGKASLAPMTYPQLIEQSANFIHTWITGDVSTDLSILRDHAKSRGYPVPACLNPEVWQTSSIRTGETLPFDPACEKLSIKTNELGISNVLDASKFISRFINYDAVSSRLCLLTFGQTLKSRLRRLVSTILYFSRPRSWEYFD